MTKAFKNHNHDACTNALLAHAERVTNEKGLRFTAMRQEVYRVLIQNHNALGAYDILAVLNVDGRDIKPPIVYRALDFLIEANLAHKVERLNAYVACQTPQVEHDAGFMICRSCDMVDEFQVDATILPISDFEAEDRIVEAQGICPKCKDH